MQSYQRNLVDDCNDSLENTMYRGHRERPEKILVNTNIMIQMIFEHSMIIPILASIQLTTDDSRPRQEVNTDSFLLLRELIVVHGLCLKHACRHT